MKINGYFPDTLQKGAEIKSSPMKICYVKMTGQYYYLSDIENNVFGFIRHFHLFYIYPLVVGCFYLLSQVLHWTIIASALSLLCSLLFLVSYLLALFVALDFNSTFYVSDLRVLDNWPRKLLRSSDATEDTLEIPVTIDLKPKNRFVFVLSTIWVSILLISLTASYFLVREYISDYRFGCMEVYTETENHVYHFQKKCDYKSSPVVEVKAWQAERDGYKPCEACVEWAEDTENEYYNNFPRMH